jgi:hypothetical protein
MLGRLNALQVHHIFPKKLLYDYGYQKAEVNAIANYCFLTQAANLSISDKRPEIYLEEVEARYPGALASQWVPQDPDLWKLENYKEFLAERRRLLAAAANRFLEELYQGSAAAPVVLDYSTELPAAVGEAGAPLSAEMDDEVQALLERVRAHGLPKPELNYEVCRPTGEVLTVVDLAWPAGVQEGFSQPVALILPGDQDQINILNQAGYRFFTRVKDLRTYLETLLDLRVETQAV